MCYIYYFGNTRRETKNHFYPFRRDSSLGLPAVASIKLCHQFFRGRHSFLFLYYPFFLYKADPQSATNCFFPAVPLCTQSPCGSHLHLHPLIPSQFHINHLVLFSTCLFLPRLPASILFMSHAVRTGPAIFPPTYRYRILYFVSPIILSNPDRRYLRIVVEKWLCFIQVMWPAFNLWHLLAAIFYYQWNQSLIDKLQTTRELKVCCCFLQCFGSVFIFYGSGSGSRG